MKNRNAFQEYVFRLLHQTGAVITGIFGFLIAFIAEVFYPSLNARIIYIVVFIGAVIIANFNVFKDLLKEYKILESKIRELEDNKPNIAVGFRDSKGHLNKSLELNISSVSSTLLT
jgi:hypothetical protein